MKMARIAGLDYAKATDYMTASLRGFNMELSAESTGISMMLFSNKKHPGHHQARNGGSVSN